LDQPIFFILKIIKTHVLFDKYKDLKKIEIKIEEVIFLEIKITFMHSD